MPWMNWYVEVCGESKVYPREIKTGQKEKKESRGEGDASFRFHYPFCDALKIAE